MSYVRFVMVTKVVGQVIQTHKDQTCKLECFFSVFALYCPGQAPITAQVPFTVQAPITAQMPITVQAPITAQAPTQPTHHAKFLRSESKVGQLNSRT